MHQKGMMPPSVTQIQLSQREGLSGQRDSCVLLWVINKKQENEGLNRKSNTWLPLAVISDTYDPLLGHLPTMANKPRRSSELPKAAVEALWQGNVIEAIKVVRQERNIGLKEAKEAVETYIASEPALKKKMDQVLATAKQRFIRWLIGFLVLAAGMAYLVMG